MSGQAEIEKVPSDQAGKEVPTGQEEKEVRAGPVHVYPDLPDVVWDALQAQEYWLQERLGKGGFGQVYRTEIFISDDIVLEKACKVLEMSHEQKSTIPGIIRTIKQWAVEMETLILMDHDNVVKQYAAMPFFDDEWIKQGIMYCFIFMDLASGDLRGLIADRGGQLKPQYVPAVFSQIAHGIEHIHLNLVAHRDLKPENVLCFQDPENLTRYQCKISDFGLAHMIGETRLKQHMEERNRKMRLEYPDQREKLHQLQREAIEEQRYKDVFQDAYSVCGTSFYKAPELRGKDYDVAYDPKLCDIWSLGIMLVEFHINTTPIFNRTIPNPFKNIPFDDQYAEELLKRCRLDSMPDQLFKNLVGRMLDVSTWSRISTIGQVVDHAWTRKGGQNSGFIEFGEAHDHLKI